MINGFFNSLLNTTGLNDVKADNVYTVNLYINNTLFNPDAINGLISQPSDLAGTNQLQKTQFNGDITQPNSSNSTSVQNLHNACTLYQDGSILQTNGNNSFQNINCKTITQSGNDYITQNTLSTEPTLLVKQILHNLQLPIV